MNIDFKTLNDNELAEAYIFIRQELRARNMSLKESKLKDRLTNKSHNVQSSIQTLSANKARPVNQQARSITSKAKNTD
ncbi:MAG: hypothetical protein CBB87_01250 [Micavibrio sp. TMED27]|jgi:hypothetical protein|nr:hypothetical protein [Micavibrio sp.]OUT92396.1 MAG: hypothetical protein CBB87_01250 [Micavibrio sp. TMED27]|tara:strand:+ start:207 stop:440 length:234 start_codon:yes stop_codon:yes gene_type:complete